MRYKLVFVFCLILPLICCSQISKNSHVKLVEKKTGKRLQLFAENKDSVPYTVFLRVITTDYRRTSQRPIIKEIPAHSKLLLKTLILLNGKEGNYKPVFIVNEVTTNLSIRKSFEDFNLSINKAKLEKTVVIYTTTTCDLCDEALVILEENALHFNNYNIETDKEAYEALKSELNSPETLDNTLYPVLKIEDTLYTKIKTREKFIKILKLHFE